MNIKYTKRSPLQIIILLFLSQLLTACIPSTFFDSGIARERAEDKTITREQLIMEPAYYLTHLDQDIDRLVWIMIPRSKILQKASAQQELTEIRELLQDYMQTLDGLPDKENLPESQLATIYIDLLHNFDNYFQDKLAINDISAQLQEQGPQIRKLEHALKDVNNRRLSTLVQTISGNSL